MRVHEPESAGTKRAIVVTNESGRHVARFVVRFDYVNVAGRMSANVFWHEPREGFAPGESHIFSLPDYDPAKSRMMAGSPNIRASLDSVLFADGDFYGIDLSNGWRRLTAEQEFIRANRIELEKIGNDMDRIQQKLEEIRRPIIDRKRPPGEVVSMTLMREFMYGGLISAAKQGYEPFRAALERGFGEQTLLVMRRKY